MDISGKRVSVEVMGGKVNGLTLKSEGAVGMARFRT